MKIGVIANDEQWKEMMEAMAVTGIVRMDSLQADGADAYILLDGYNDSALLKLEKPVLLNSVTHTLKELHTGNNVLRINGWNGFLQRKTWEVTGIITDDVRSVFVALEKQYIQVPDEPGLVAARSISMIINEAYFALGESVSTKKEIDIAMKLGTNYPLGPFEWAEKIGLKNIYELLSVLSKADKRYLPAPSLAKEVNAWQ